MKYVVSVDENGLQEIFTFPRTVDHDCMAIQIENIRSSLHGNFFISERHVISAGFIQGRNCYGRSESLDLDSRPEDSDLLRHQLYT